MSRDYPLEKVRNFGTPIPQPAKGARAPLATRLATGREVVMYNSSNI